MQMNYSPRHRKIQLMPFQLPFPTDGQVVGKEFTSCRKEETFLFMQLSLKLLLLTILILLS